MFGFIVFLHTFICILLVIIILMQSGRGGGLTESFSAAESLFGARTNVVLVKATTVLASFFIISCLTLAFLSTRNSKSLISESAINSKPAANSASAVSNVPTQEAVPQVSVETKTAGENANLEKPKAEPPANAAVPSNPQ